MKCDSCESKKAIETLKIAKGQIEGIIKMIESERYCIDVSKQILSVNGLIKKANLIILKQHLQTCVKEAFLQGNENEKIEEIMLILEKYTQND
ncbi:MAG TPA: metal-sensing transcriptional repressor [Spirochaetota bacterium]|nr:metal-sensing transcriptional repressor [Spirochaetota bacterium]HOL57178.1 metal-sensing transcriptional repressor [Spirochaetota bacterium]HPP04798.1 metal-sensing transcriptional repressor [Spirochaetota bacterium]